MTAAARECFKLHLCPPADGPEQLSDNTQQRLSLNDPNNQRPDQNNLGPAWGQTDLRPVRGNQNSKRRVWGDQNDLALGKQLRSTMMGPE